MSAIFSSVILAATGPAMPPQTAVDKCLMPIFVASGVMVLAEAKGTEMTPRRQQVKQLYSNTRAKLVSWKTRYQGFEQTHPQFLSRNLATAQRYTAQSNPVIQLVARGKANGQKYFADAADCAKMALPYEMF